MITRTSLVFAAAVFMGNVSLAGATPRAATTRVSDLRPAMNRLWEDHVMWTRLYIISALAESADKPATTERLLQNQIDIGNAMKPFYGDAAGDALSALLKQHVLIAADVIASAKARDGIKEQQAILAWRSNADEIALFLAKANPRHWPATEMKAMMREHLDATTAEVVARLTGDWKADVKAYDAVHDQILHMSTMLSDGIVEQFPRQFAAR